MSSSPKSTVIEQHSIDFVPSSERRGKVWHQAPFWFAGNFVLPTMLIGFLGPQLGVAPVLSVIAIISGVLFGTFFMAFHANQGPKMGLPQMIQSRAQFGSRGALVPFIATVFVYVGFLVFDTVLATQAIQTVAPMSELIWYPILIAVSIIIAVVGHDLLHFIQRWLTYFMVAIFAVITVVGVSNFNANPELTSAGSWDISGFLVMFALAAGYNISYAVYVSDYTRYLPANVSSKKLIFSVYSGAAFSAIWLMSLGVAVGALFPEGDVIAALQSIGDSVFPGFGQITVIVSALALISIMGVNAYGAMLTGTTAVDGFRNVRPTVRLRVIGLSLVGVLSLIIALALPADYLASFNNFVLLMLYFLVPWTAVNLVDFYFVRKGVYSIVDIFKTDGIYGRWGWRGVTAYFIGLIAMIPFMYSAFYVGPIAEALGGADLSFLVGLIVSGGVYLLFARSLDLPAEKRAAEESARQLADA